MDSWTEEELYELAKRVHADKRPSPPALKVLCMDFTINKWKTWTDLNEELGINAFTKLSPLLRNDLIDRLTTSESFHWDQRDFLLLLLTAQTKSLVMEICQNHSTNDFYQKYLSFITEVVLRAPNLFHLSLSERYDNYFFPNDIKTLILSAICELKNLQHLNLLGCFELDSEDLMLVTKNLKNLVILKVRLGARKIKVHGFENMRELKKLEEFHYEISAFDEKNYERYDKSGTTEWIYSWCAQNVPRLKLIGFGLDGSTQCTFDSTPSFSGTSNLRSFHTKSYLPEASFPELNYLLFTGPTKELNFVTKICSFKNLTVFEADSVEINVLRQVLGLIGTQLVQLCVIDYNEAELDFYYEVFYLCPNLVQADLHMDAHLDPLVSKYKELVCGRNFVRLERFECGYSDHHTSTLPIGFLSYIFHAPKIRIIAFCVFSFRREDFDWLSDVQEGRFQTLETVNFDDLHLEPGCEMDHVGKMVKFLVCGAPNLKSVSIEFDEWSNPINQKKWLESQAGAIKFMELVKGTILCEK